MPSLLPLAALGPATTALAVVLDVALILVVAAAAGRLARRLGQPAVVGEILAGIALGPSLLGLLWGAGPGTLFPDEARPALRTIADVALVLFLFGVGREADPGLVRRASGRVGALAAGSIVVPAVVGVLVAVALSADPVVADGDAVPRAGFVAFVAIALSVTAFPVLARMLDEAGMLRGRLGTTAMAVAAVTDLAAWSALAVLVAAAGTGGRSTPVLIAAVPVSAAVLLLVLRPAVARVLGRLAPGAPRLASAAPLLIGLGVAAATTDALGLHAAIGAFAFGLASPRVGRAGAAADRGAGLIARIGLLLVPVFFLSTGLGVDLASVGAAGAGDLVVLFLAATLAKFAGVAGAARLAGMGRRDAVVLGTLLNARGLTELVVLEVGRTAGLLDDRTFAALVAVALLTTVLAGATFRRMAADEDLECGPEPLDTPASASRRHRAAHREA